MWTPEEKTILESFNVTIVTLRFLIEILGIVMAIATFLLYSITDYMSTFFVWFSDLGVWRMILTHFQGYFGSYNVYMDGTCNIHTNSTV